MDTKRRNINFSEQTVEKEEVYTDNNNNWDHKRGEVNKIRGYDITDSKETDFKTNSYHDKQRCKQTKDEQTLINLVE